MTQIRDLVLGTCEFVLPECLAMVVVDFFMPEDGKEYFQLRLELFQLAHPKDDMFEILICTIQNVQLFLRWGLQTRGRFRIRFVHKTGKFGPYVGKRVLFEDLLNPNPELLSFPFILNDVAWHYQTPLTRTYRKWILALALWVGIRKLCNLEIATFEHANDDELGISSMLQRFIQSCEFPSDQQHSTN